MFTVSIFIIIKTFVLMKPNKELILKNKFKLLYFCGANIGLYAIFCHYFRQDFCIIMLLSHIYYHEIQVKPPFIYETTSQEQSHQVILF